MYDGHNNYHPVKGIDHHLRLLQLLHLLLHAIVIVSQVAHSGQAAVYSSQL